ncbi:MAG TPA: hypothetical protein PKH77_27675, partial [Anaerolineae bacterium]|nr:hypothetical protein [Anaerolineae bacterium]
TGTSTGTGTGTSTGTGTGGGATQGPQPFTDEWAAYRALGDDYEAKRQFMADNPEFEAYYIEWGRGKYGDEFNVWWQGGGRSSGKTSSKAGSKVGQSWNQYWNEYRSLGSSAEKAAYLRTNPEFADYYAANYSNGERWWETAGTGRSLGSYGGYRSYGGGGGGGGGGGRRSIDFSNMPRIGAAEYNYNLMPQARNLESWRPADVNMQWLQAGANLRPRDLPRWRLRD